MKTNKVLGALMVSGIVFCSSCATLFTSSTETVQISSDPPGATYQFGPYSGKTPDSIAVPKKAIPDVATFEMPGYERRTVPIESGISGVFWVNILFWPGIIVDMVTGDYKTLPVNDVRANLTPVTVPNAAGVAPSAAVRAVASDHR